LKINIINTSKFIKLSDYVFSAAVEVSEYKNLYAKNSTVILEKKIDDTGFVFFINNNLNIKDGDIIYSHTEAVESLFKLLKNSNLKNLILISGQSDISVNKKLYQKKPKCIKYWFGNNINYEINKLIPIPLGINNDYVSTNPNEQDFIDFKFKNFDEKNNNLYSNFNINTRPFHRLDAYNFSIKNVSTVSNFTKLNKSDFLSELNNYKFVIAPFGNGLDTHRVWEAIYSNSIPIVTEHTSFNSFKELPIHFVKNFKDIDNKSLSKLKFDVNFLRLCDFNYWRDLILDLKSKLTIDFKSSNEQSISVPSFEIIKKIRRKTKINSLKKSFIMFIFKIYKKIYN
tara:strand:+ start:3907 stop:4929 length:1023 start_codon:yes stop_codon:yes gene_type:complete